MHHQRYIFTIFSNQICCSFKIKIEVQMCFILEIFPFSLEINEASFVFLNQALLSQLHSTIVGHECLLLFFIILKCRLEPTSSPSYF